MDQTLIDTSSSRVETYSQMRQALNMRLLNEVLIPAAALRDSGKVDAILLLTNSTRKHFVTELSLLISKLTGSISKYTVDSDGDIQSFFDYKMTKRHPTRAKVTNPSKTLNDVRYMLEQLSIPTDSLEERVYFFDDRDDHAIKNEINPYHYIHIESNRATASGFTRGTPNITNYSHVMEAFDPVPHPVLPGKRPPASSPLTMRTRPKAKSVLSVKRSTSGGTRKRTRKAK